MVIAGVNLRALPDRVEQGVAEPRGVVRPREETEQLTRDDVEEQLAAEAAGRSELLPQKRTDGHSAEVGPDSKQARSVAGLPVCQVADLPRFSDPEATIAYLSPDLGEEEHGDLIIGSVQRGGSSPSTSTPGGNARGDAAGSKARDGDAVLNVGDYEIDVGNCESVRCADTGVLLDPAAVRRGRLCETADNRRFRVWDYVSNSKPLPLGAKLCCCSAR